NYWRQRDLDLHEPEFPLTGIILSTPEQFVTFAERDVGPAALGSKGYYSIMSNRMVLFDVAGLPAGSQPSVQEIQRKLVSAPFNIATVVHEATHQMAFNSGMHTRLADNPLWLVEGMAMFFETPDLTSRSGWRTV